MADQSDTFNFKTSACNLNKNISLCSNQNLNDELIQNVDYQSVSSTCLKRDLMKLNKKSDKGWLTISPFIFLFHFSILLLFYLILII